MLHLREQIEAAMERIKLRFSRHAGAGATEGASRISAMQAIPLVLETLRFDPAAFLNSPRTADNVTPPSRTGRRPQEPARR